MTIDKNIPVTSASQISVYVQNVRSLNTSVPSHKLTRPLDSNCDIYIFVDARVTELKLHQLWSNFKVRMSDMQCYSCNSLIRGILILCKKSSGCTIENAELVDKDSQTPKGPGTFKAGVGLQRDPINVKAISHIIKVSIASYISDEQTKNSILELQNSTKETVDLRTMKLKRLHFWRLKTS